MWSRCTIVSETHHANVIVQSSTLLELAVRLQSDPYLTLGNPGVPQGYAPEPTLVHCRTNFLPYTRRVIVNAAMPSLPGMLT